MNDDEIQICKWMGIVILGLLFAPFLMFLPVMLAITLFGGE
jgi:hypothetical protein